MFHIRVYCLVDLSLPVIYPCFTMMFSNGTPSISTPLVNRSYTNVPDKGLLLGAV